MWQGHSDIRWPLWGKIRTKLAGNVWHWKTDVCWPWTIGDAHIQCRLTNACRLMMVRAVHIPQQLIVVWRLRPTSIDHSVHDKGDVRRFYPTSTDRYVESKGDVGRQHYRLTDQSANQRWWGQATSDVGWMFSAIRAGNSHVALILFAHQWQCGKSTHNDTWVMWPSLEGCR